ncbi:MAG: efflux RND transporter permease subunit [Saprospiraceae bacterium]
MRGIIDYFIKNEIAANLLMFGLFLLGAFGMLNMKSTFFPETPSRIITIQTIYPGASPEEVEEGIVSKIEDNLKGLTGVERYTSVSSENLGSITVEILPEYDTDLILQDVKNAVDQINSFPVGMEPPVVYKRESLGFAISFAITGDVDLKTLKRFAREAEDDLLAIDGLSKVELSGFPDEEIEIAFREKDLRAYGLTFQEATRAVQVANLDITGGTLKGEEEELLVRARNKNYYAEGLRNIVLKTNTNGSVIRLFEVADVRDQWEDNPQRSYLNGKPSVVVTVQNTLEEDILDIVEKVKVYMEEYNERNDIVQAELIRDGSKNLVDRIDLLVENGVLGFLIVTILLAIFLHYRLAFWVALAIPISFAGMFLCAYLLGVTINVISLFAMILVIGILVDDGIVIAESIYQEYEKGVPPMEAALEGTMKVLPAVFAAILTTIIAFSTFIFIEGRLGDIFYEMSIVIILSLIFSLVEGAFILSAHTAHSRALNPQRQPNRLQRGLNNLMVFLRDKMYAPVLRFSMRNGFLVFGLLTGILIMSFGLLSGGIVKSTFFPIIEPDNVTVTLELPSGTRENITSEWLDKIEQAALRANKNLSEEYLDGEQDVILRIEKKINAAPNKGTINLTILEGEKRGDLRARQIANAVREESPLIYEAEVLSFGAVGTFGKPVSVSLVGENYDELDRAANDVKQRLKGLAELTDIIDTNQEGLREINISLKEKALYLGLNLQEIVGQVRRGFFGSEVQRLQRGQDEVRVWVRYDESDRTDITKLQDMRVRFADGREFPLAEIANLEIDRGVISIRHLEGKREISISADVSNDDVSVSDVTTLVKGELVPEVLNDYPTVQAVYEGQNREQEKTGNSIALAGPVILLLMFFCIAITFRSIGQTIMVLLIIPYGMIGVIAGHWIMGIPMSLFSALGIIALVGILVNDSLVMVSSYNDLIKEGYTQMDAIYEAGTSRFRPILLTTLTTFAGLAPLLAETSLQAQFLLPMAASVSFGLLAVTVAILVLLPAFLIALNRFKVYASYAWNGVKPSYESVEPSGEGDGGYGYLWYLLLAIIIVVGLINNVL